MFVHWDGTVTLGSVLQIFAMCVALVSVWVALERRLVAFQETLKVHAGAIVEHSKRIDQQDDHILNLVANLQRLIGRMEVDWQERRLGMDRRGGSGSAGGLAPPPGV